MKTLCKNRTAADQVRVCKTINVLLLICIAIFVALTIFDLVQGLPIEGSRVAIFCCDVCILCLNIKNQKAAQERLAEENAENN